MRMTKRLDFGRWRMVWGVMACLLLGVLTGCQPEAPLPTEVLLPSPTPPASPTPIPTATRPQPTLTPSPTAFFGRGRVPETAQTPFVRVTNATAADSTFDLYLNGQLLQSGLRAGLAGISVPVLPGTYDLSLSPDGAPLATFEAVNGQITDLTLTGDPDQPQALTHRAPTEPLDAQSAWATVINALPDTALQLSLDDQPVADLAAQSVAEPVVIARGDRQLRVSVGDAVLFEQPLRVQNRTSYTFIVSRNPQAPDQLTVQRLETVLQGRYSVRLIHLSPELREVDVYLNDAIWAQAVGYTGLAEPRTVTTAPQLLSVYTAGADRNASQPLIAPTPLNGRDDAELFLLLTGTPDQLRLIPFEPDRSPVPNGSSRYVFFNPLPDVSGLTTGEEGFQPLGYGQFSQPAVLPAQSTVFRFRDANNPDIDIIEEEPLDIEAGQSVLYAVSARDDLPAARYALPIEQSEALAQDGSALPQSRLRFVNALATGVAIDIYVDGVLVFPSLIAGAGGPLTNHIGAEFRLLVAQSGGGGAALIDVVLPVATPSDYSVFIYGSPTDGLRAVAIDDAALLEVPGSATMRLVNLSLNLSDSMGISLVPYAPDVTPVFPTPTFPPPPDATPAPTPELLSLPLDVRLLLRNVQPGTASIQTFAPQTYFDALIVNADNRIIDRERAILIPVGQHYDLVAYTYRTESGVQTTSFIAPYPPR
jgi:hypothetical protein